MQAIRKISKVSTHSRPKAAGFLYLSDINPLKVSTHSRPKAAGVLVCVLFACSYGFNTQPPEGGWSSLITVFFAIASFQHTAARRRLAE